MRIAAGDAEEGEPEGVSPRISGGAVAVQEGKQVVGIRPGGVEPDDEVNRAMALDDAFEALQEEGVAGGRLGEREFVGGGLKVVAEESGVVAAARGVDADAEAWRRLRSGNVVW